MSYFKSICGDSPIWDANLSWNSTEPDLSECFQSTFLIWIPTVVLWILASFEIYKSASSKKSANPLSPLHISKQVLNLLVLLTSCIKLACLSVLFTTANGEYQISSILGAAIQIFNMLLVLFLTTYTKRKGILVSNALPIFWLLQLVSFIIMSYSASIKSLWFGGNVKIVLCTAIVVSALLAFFLLLLTSFSETGSTFVRLDDSQHHQRKNCPAEKNSFFSFITFFWATKLVRECYKEQIKSENLDPLCGDMRSAKTTRDFDAIFLPKFNQNVQEMSEVEYSIHHFKKKSLLFSLWRMAWWPFFLGAIYELLAIFSSFIPPYAMHLILGFIESNELEWHGYVYAICFWLANVLSAVLDTVGQYFCMVAAVQIKSALISAVYRKILLLNNSSKRTYTSGEIVNLMSIDTEEIFTFTSYVYQMFGIPIRVTLTMYFLWAYIGPAALASLVVFALFSPISYCFGRKVDNLQEKVMLKRDKRIKQMSEILRGIKILKLYAWEVPFMKQVLKTRDEELKFLRTSCYVDSFFVFLWIVAPFLVCAVCFGSFLLSSSEHVLDAQTAFVSLSLFNLLRYPMGILPDLLTRLIKSGVSLKRLNKFLYCEEIDIFNVNSETETGDAVTFKNATLSWGDLELEPAVKDVSLKIAKGSLVAIVGKVGSGKSSLLAAILGEMQKMSGHVSITGKIAYVPQLAWIQNATFQNNILFKKPFIQSHYDSVIKCCALEPDLELLGGGDKTEIGEKGINLSGGQKQRISLARAVYQDEDIYLLDDPLSAVDANVASTLFNEIIGPIGMLKKKTRILATHNITYLSEMDQIFVVSEGEIVERGNYQQLLNSKGKFSEFLNQHTNQVETENETPTINSINMTLHRQLSIISNNSLASQTENNLQVGQLIEEETMASGKVKWSVYKKYIKSMGIAVFGLIFILNALSGGLETGSGLWISHWSTEAGNRKSQLAGLEVYFAFIGSLAVVICLSYVILFWATVRAAKKLHIALLISVIKSPLSFFDTTPMGRVLNRFSKDIESIDSEIPYNLGSTLNQICWLPMMCIIISLASIYLLPFMIFAFIIYSIVLRYYIQTSNQLRRLDSITRSPLYSNFTETIQGVSSIRAYRAQKFFINRSNEKVDNSMKCYYFSELVSRWLDSSLTVVASIIILGTAFICVFERENLSTGVLGLALTYCAELTGGMSYLVKMGAQLESQIVGLERVLEYSVLPPEGEWEMSETKPSNEWPDKGEIKVINYSTIYREGLDPVLIDINLNIASGCKVGIVGRTGAGKSSFILALFRILEATQGKIVIDNVDISKIGTHDLRSKLTVIPQDPVLFAGSLRMNLDPWDEHSDDEIWLSLERSHLKSFVTTLPLALEHEITEGGENLSAGQRQLVCLARALLRRTKILVLDEATASVDLDTDQLIQETVREAFSDCTVIIIAHRLHTILKCDKIICFAQGHLCEEGAPNDLLKDSSSHFYSMAKDAGLL